MRYRPAASHPQFCGYRLHSLTIRADAYPMKRIAILGSTGSIGRSTLSVVESYPDRFQVATLAAGNNAELAFEQAVRWKPRVLSLAKEEDAATLRAKLRRASLAETEVVHGPAGTVQVATHP